MLRRALDRRPPVSLTPPKMGQVAWRSPGTTMKGRTAMYPRFGMTHVAILTAQARARAAHFHPQDGDGPRAHGPVFSDADSDVTGALWRMGAVIAVITALAGSFFWLGA
jgi:hypothetical protein